MGHFSSVFPGLKNLLRILYYMNLKTLRFNLRYFPFRDAMRFPVFVSRNVKFRTLKGDIEIKSPLKTGMIRIGYGKVGIFDERYTRAIWEVSGKVIFRGEAMIKFGAAVSVGPGAILDIGDRFRISSNSKIICFKKVRFGENCRISWNVQFMDTDFHYITDMGGNILNHPRKIHLGNNVWVGSHCTFSKGAILPDNTIVASRSLVNKEFEGEYQVIGGAPAKVIKSDVKWWDENEYADEFGETS